MAGCDSCAKNLRAELGSKDDDDLTEEERAVLEGEKEAPKYYGPLSSWEGDFCEFCHGIGQAGAVFFGLLSFVVMTDFVSSYGIGILVGLVVWLSLALVVGYVGRFPLLGALFGPIVEKVFALQFGVYLTEKAKRDYGSGVAADGGPGTRSEQVERRFPLEGAEMHVVASPWALETCADMSKSGALIRLEVENGQIVDRHSFHPEFNRFPNLVDHVGFRQFDNVCQAHAQRDGPTTVIEFAEVVGSDGDGGIS